jgi:hypothetical protein
MSTLMQASNQWARRPDDERFTNLDDMLRHFETVRRQSAEHVMASRRLRAMPEPDHKGLTIIGPEDRPYSPTHYAFGQLSQLADAPAGYLRRLPSPIAADCLNVGLQFLRQIEDVGVLTQDNGTAMLRAATGPRYGRVWNVDVIRALVDRFGDGVTGDWTVPGEFGVALDKVTKANTTLFASDHDCFVFLADEKNRIEVPGRRNGEPGTMARGFFCWNSEVGDKTLGLAMFGFDYVCMNRIVWGAKMFSEVRIRHTASAPDKWLDEVMPAIDAYRASADANISKAIEDARNKRIGDKLDEFLGQRFGARMVDPLKLLHESEEGKPIETLWDAATAATAYARSIPHTDRRIELERKAGEIIDLAA